MSEAVQQVEAPVRWMRDGHTATVVLDRDTLVIHLQCPNEAEVPPETPWDALPSCRKGYGEYGVPDPDDSPLGYCNFAEWATAGGQPIELIDTDVTQGREWLINGAFPIGWRWDGDTYLWAPSALIDEAEAQR